MKEERTEFKQVLPVAIVSWSGALLEWVDFYIYAILAKVLAKIYFPSDDPLASCLQPLPPWQSVFSSVLLEL